MKATVTEGFHGVADGEIHPRVFVPGETIAGDLAQAMVADGKAEWIKPAKKPAAQSKAKTARQDKSLRSAPRNKSTS